MLAASLYFCVGFPGQKHTPVRLFQLCSCYTADAALLQRVPCAHSTGQLRSILVTRVPEVRQQSAATPLQGSRRHARPDLPR
jgi:hypothetical protein